MATNNPFLDEIAQAEQQNPFLAEIDQAEPPVDPTWGRRGKDVLHDLAVSAETGAKRGAEFMLDVANLPISLTERFERGFSAWTDDDPETGFISEFSRPSTIGQSTAALTGVDNIDEMRIPRGENVPLDVARDVTRLGTEYAVTAPLGGFKALPQTLKAIPYVMAGAGVGGQVSDSDTGADIGSIAGGFAPMVKSLTGRLIAKGAYKADRAGTMAKNLFTNADTLATATKSDIELAMNELYANAYADMPMTPEILDNLVETVRTNLAAGKKGTLAQLSGDRGLIEFERGFSQGKPALPNAAQDRNLQTQFEQTQQDLAEEANRPMREVAPTGESANASEAFKQQERMLQREIQQQGEQTASAVEQRAAEQAEPILKQATTAAEQARQEARIRSGDIIQEAEQQAAPLVPEAESKLVQTKQAVQAQRQAFDTEMMQKAAPEGVEITAAGHEGFRQLDDAVQAGYARAWSGAPELTASTRDALTNRLKSALEEGGFSAEGRTAIERAIKDITNMPAPNAGGNFRALDRSIRDIMGDPNTPYEAVQELRVIRDMLRSELGGEAAELLKAMDAKYPEYLVMRRATTAGQREGGLPTSANLAAANKAVYPDTAVSRGETPYSADVRAKKLDEDLAKGDLQQSNTEISEAKRQAEAIRSAGQQQAKTAITEGETAAKNIEGAAEGEVKAITQAAQDQAKGFKQAAGEDVLTGASKEMAKAGTGAQVDAVRKIMNSKSTTKIEDLRQLLFDIGDNPQAREDVRRAFMDDFMNTVTKDGKLTRDGYNKFKERRQIYEESGMFTKDELDRIDAGMAEAQKMYIYDAEKLAKLPPAERRLSEAVAALAGAKVGAMAMGSPLIGASLGRRAATRFYNKATTERIIKLANELALNPDKFVKYADEFKQGGITPERFDELLNDMLESVMVSTAPKTEEFKEDEN